MKTESEINEWKEFRKDVYENKSKSEDDFEKYITLIASGALGLSLTLIDKIVPIESATYKCILITGWVFFSLTLLSSLLSHFFSKRFSEKTINEVDKDVDYDTIVKNIESRNSVIEGFNIFSIFTIVMGIFSIVLFVSINI